MNHVSLPSAEALLTWRPSGTKPRSVYLHIPFCRHRCGYCNFSLVANRDYLVDRFLDAIEKEIGWLDDHYELDTLFLGGGTPSHLTPANLDRLKSIVRSRFIVKEYAEVSAECNPNDLTEEKADALARFGINRISLGVQSMNPEKLSCWSAITKSRMWRAINHARRFAKSVSIDLIFAAPEETLEQWEQDLTAALKLDPDHISTYELTYEKGTQFWNRQSRGELLVSDEDARADMYERATQLVEKAGLHPYEISSFAKPNHQSRHNESYWVGGPYFAFGPGASRYIDGIRQTNHQSTTHYLKLVESGESPVAFSEKLSPEDSARELLAIGLRRVAGVDDAGFEALTQFRVSDLLPDVKNEWLQEGLIIHANDNWSLTFRGRMLCDRIALQIVNR